MEVASCPPCLTLLVGSKSQILPTVNGRGSYSGVWGRGAMGEPGGCSPQSLLCVKGNGRYFCMCYIIYSLKQSVRQVLPHCIDEKPETGLGICPRSYEG